MNKPLVVLATASVALGSVALAGPAAAYDRDAYAYGAGHMIERSDVPAVLGALRPTLDFSAYPNISPNFLCDVPQSDPQARDVIVKFPAGKYSFSGSYDGRGSDAPTVEVTVIQYADAQAAIGAFGSLRKGIKTCTGTGSNTWTDDDGTETTYSTQLTHGIVPSVTVTGVPSVFVSDNSLSETTPGDSRNVNDQYTVYSLVDDVIIQTQYYANNNSMTTKQRKAVNKVAFNAITRWLDQA